MLTRVNGSVLVMHHYDGEELSTSCWEEMPFAFTLSGVVHKITAFQVTVPHLFDREGSYEEPVEKDMPPFILKSRHLIHSIQETNHNAWLKGWEMCQQ